VRGQISDRGSLRRNCRLVAKSPPCPTLPPLLKAEISRVARKELRPVLDAVSKTAATQRAEIAGLRKRLHELECQLKAQGRESRRQKAASAAELTVDDASGLRFRAAGMASNRERLGLSARDFGRLIGATAQAVHAWETGKRIGRPVHQALHCPIGTPRRANNCSARRKQIDLRSKRRASWPFRMKKFQAHHQDVRETKAAYKSIAEAQSEAIAPMTLPR